MANSTQSFFITILVIFEMVVLATSQDDNSTVNGTEETGTTESDNNVTMTASDDNNITAASTGATDAGDQYGDGDSQVCDSYASCNQAKLEECLPKLKLPYETSPYQQHKDYIGTSQEVDLLLFDFSMAVNADGVNMANLTDVVTNYLCVGITIFINCFKSGLTDPINCETAPDMNTADELAMGIWKECIMATLDRKLASNSELAAAIRGNTDTGAIELKKDGAWSAACSADGAGLSSGFSIRPTVLLLMAPIMVAHW